MNNSIQQKSLDQCYKELTEKEKTIPVIYNTCSKCGNNVESYRNVYSYKCCDDCFLLFFKILDRLESKAESRAIKIFFGSDLKS